MRIVDWRQMVTLAVVLFGFTFCSSMRSFAEPEPDPEAILAEDIPEMNSMLIEAIEFGDFESAWQIHTRIWALVVLDRDAHRVFFDICSSGGCPDYGRLTWLLGKSRGDLNSIDRALEKIDDPRSAESWRDYFRTVVFPYVGLTKRSGRGSTTEVPLYFPYEENYGDLRPHVFAQIGDDSRPYWSMLDTGSPEILVEGHVDGSTDAFRILSTAQTRKRWDGSEELTSQISVNALVVGDVREEFVPARKIEALDEGLETTRFLVLGTLLFHRYDAVCIGRESSALFLGQLGPCSDARRLSPSQAKMDTNLVPTVVISMRGRDSLTALIDSGSDVNLCKASLANQLDGNVIHFGSHRLLKTACSADAPHLLEGHSYDMVIGMETLGNFRAIGWELKPFRLYFVPARGQR